MIHDFDPNSVVIDTSITEQVEIMSTPKGRHAKDTVLLIAEIALLHRHNQVLHNCWQEAKSDYSKSQQDLRAYIDRVELLEKEVEELRADLNPKDAAA